MNLRIKKAAPYGCHLKNGQGKSPVLPKLGKTLKLLERKLTIFGK